VDLAGLSNINLMGQYNNLAVFHCSGEKQTYFNVLFQKPHQVGHTIPSLRAEGKRLYEAKEVTGTERFAGNCLI